MCGPISCIFLNVIIFVTMLTLGIINSIKYSKRDDFNNIKCNITKIEYPLKIPDNIDDYSNSNFVNCDCGKSCIGDLGICNKIFITIDDSNEILLQNRFDSDDSLCTFREKKCKNGEKISNRIVKIYDNINEMKKYEKYISDNTLMDCYKYNNVYFVNDYNYYKEMVIFMSIAGFEIIAIIIIGRYCQLCDI
jgi:hypothetical protein